MWLIFQGYFFAYNLSECGHALAGEELEKKGIPGQISEP